MCTKLNKLIVSRVPVVHSWNIFCRWEIPGPFHWLSSFLNGVNVLFQANSPAGSESMLTGVDQDLIESDNESDKTMDPTDEYNDFFDDDDDLSKVSIH